MDSFSIQKTKIYSPVSKNIGFFNARVKYYPTSDGGRKAVEVCAFSEPVYNPNHLESLKSKKGKSVVSPDKNKEAKAENGCSDYAIRRARRRLYDLVSCNPECNMMATLTLNGEDFPRDDWAKIIPRVNTWLDNMTRRHGLKYVFVPEYHADGKSVHFHGFVNESALRLSRAINPKTDKPLFQKGRAVYNIQNWSYGFTTAVRVGKSEQDQDCAARYVLKYITKGQEKIGGRYYLHGGDLQEPTFEYFNSDFAQLREGWQEFAITENLTCKVKKLSGTSGEIDILRNVNGFPELEAQKVKESEKK